MAKNVIKKPPFEFNYGLYNIFTDENYKYHQRYKEVDGKGRYLYWDEFEWRVHEEDDPLIAWYAVKTHRMSGRKLLALDDKENIPFSYTVPNSLQAKLYKISDFSREGIVPINSIGEKYLISSLVIEEAISSSQLEGVSTTRRVAKDMLESERKPRNEDEQMIVNNYLLMKEIKRDRYEDLSIDMILKFHKIATRETTENSVVPGKLREDDEIYIADGMEGNVIYQPPTYHELRRRLNQLCYFANQSHTDADFINPVLKAIILHFMMGYIHPFSDGNGRTARALFYWFMLKHNYEYFEYVSISKLLKEAPAKYGKSYLYSEYDDNDLNYFLYYQVDIILRAIDELRNYLEVKSIEFEEVTEILKGSNLSDKLNFTQKDIVKKSIKSPGRVFTANEVAVDYDISANTARKYLNELVKYKILANYKDGKTISYIAPENLHDILKKAK